MRRGARALGGDLMIRKLLIAGALACLAAPALAQDQTTPPATTTAQAPAEPRPPETCGILSTGDASSSFTPIVGYTILWARPPMTRPEGDVDGILCVRSHIYLGVNDHRVLTDLAVPFFIRDATRLATLEMSNGQLRLRFVTGSPTAGEAAALALAIDAAHNDIASRPVTR